MFSPHTTLLLSPGLSGEPLQTCSLTGLEQTLCPDWENQILTPENLSLKRGDKVKQLRRTDYISHHQRARPHLSCSPLCCSTWHVESPHEIHVKQILELADLSQLLLNVWAVHQQQQQHPRELARLQHLWVHLAPLDQSWPCTRAQGMCIQVPGALEAQHPVHSPTWIPSTLTCCQASSLSLCCLLLPLKYKSDREPPAETSMAPHLTGIPSFLPTLSRKPCLICFQRLLTPLPPTALSSPDPETSWVQLEEPSRASSTSVLASLIQVTQEGAEDTRESPLIGVEAGKSPRRTARELSDLRAVSFTCHCDRDKRQPNT